ncbi:MAG: rRNA maturation RNase YbeY [Candidatus Izemoplasmatales bacterium]|uniref:Endoribonuclease YbeY n=1 Tax=Hujiaoplasma nucleasis TaxID=2725268 RepID=A0A7L6N4R5_9MOLU|nr:rRNA maturation RNase YbeY [Hujiaoplasma nucleasis]QLY39569.1 rRNA maturation RNase YbeY [Hujiaoplasma nucleasis]
MININIINQYDQESKYDIIIQKIIFHAYDYMSMSSELVINVILIDDIQMKEYNQYYRQIDKSTDVLSFENEDSDDELGDIFISIDKTKSQALEYGHSFERELAFLTLHGFLHCLGYDHLNDDEERIMFKLQDEIIDQTEFRR